MKREEEKETQKDRIKQRDLTEYLDKSVRRTNNDKPHYYKHVSRSLCVWRVSILVFPSYFSIPRLLEKTPSLFTCPNRVPTLLFSFSSFFCMPINTTNRVNKFQIFFTTLSRVLSSFFFVLPFLYLFESALKFILKIPRFCFGWFLFPVITERGYIWVYSVDWIVFVILISYR